MRVETRRFVFLFLAAIIGGKALAQNYSEENSTVFSGGLVLGTNFSQVDGDTYYGYHKVGLCTGGVVNIRFNEVFGASMELLYSQKGSRGELVAESPAIGTYVEKYFMNLNYVEVPITLRLLQTCSRYIDGGIDFEAGVSYARLIRSKEWIDADLPVIIDPDLNRFNTMDINYILGVSKKIYKQWQVSIRYQYSALSIRPVERVPYGYSWGNEGQFNNLFSFRLMYMF